MTQKPDAVLHIGTPKTGSTSIQSFLNENRERLHAHGLHYARSPGKRNHTALAAYGAGESHGGNLVRRSGGAGGHAAMAARLERALREEVEGLPAGVRTVLFSSEQLATRLPDAEAVARLHGLLAPLFGRVRVLVYLRRQDEAAVSRYSTSLRAGGETSPDIFPGEGEEGRIYDLAGVLDRYAGAFGADNLMPRIFDRESLLGGDVVRDFLHAVGAAALDPGATERTRNPALRADVQEVLRRFNARVEALELEDRPRIGPSLRDVRFQGRARLPGRAEAAAFLERFREGNERIRARWFPDRPSLFSTDLSRYPEVEDRAALADDRLLDAALDVLVAVAGELREAKAEAAHVLGREAEAAGRLDEARRHYSKVLREERGHRKAGKALRRLDQVEAGGAPEAEDDDDGAEDAAAPATADGGRRRRAERAAAKQEGRGKRRKDATAAAAGAPPRPAPGAVDAPRGRNAAEREARRAARRARGGGAAPAPAPPEGTAP